MRVIGPSSADEMVAVFLAGELASTRFSGVRDVLTVFGIDETIVRDPDLDDLMENHVRALMLCLGRGYPSRLLFDGFPTNSAWAWCDFDLDDLANLVYINVPSWGGEISGSTRTPQAGASFMADHSEEPIAGVCQSIVAALRTGETLSPLIVVGASEDDRLIVIMLLRG